MTENEKEKSLIDLAREQMEKAGVDPEQGYVAGERPVTAPQPVEKPVEAPVATKNVEQEEIKEAFDGTVESTVEALLANVDTDTDWRPVKLPSRGKAYVECEESIYIRPFTYKEERKLRSIRKAAQGAKVIKSLFQNCVRGLEYDSMTLEDKSYVLFKLREISYGDEYGIQAICPECDAKNNLTVNISSVPVLYAEDDYEEPLKVTLPDSKQEVMFVTPRCKDEHYFESMDKLTDNLWRFMLSVGKYSDEQIKKAFLERTTVRDIAFFREHVTKERFGMKKNVSFECAGCGEVQETVLPFTESFFSVS